MKNAGRIKGLVMTGFGLNCEDETAHALERAGAEAVRVHFNDLLAGAFKLAEAHLLCLIGGFSFGDHIAAGAVLASKMKARLGSQLSDFTASGRLVIGICNGFQTLTRLGLLPGGGGRFERRATLAPNDSGVFRNAWVKLKVNPASPCVFTRGIETLELPVRHGEGKFVTDGPATEAELEARGQKALFYADPETGLPTEEFPHNPNGSPGGVAGVCDRSGRIFGLMPHPEAYLYPWNHPDYARLEERGSAPAEGAGLALFRNAVAFARENF